MDLSSLSLNKVDLAINKIVSDIKMSFDDTSFPIDVNYSVNSNDGGGGSPSPTLADIDRQVESLLKDG